MELTAAISGRVPGEKCEVELVTDSQYLKHGVTEFLRRWRTNGWQTSDGKRVQNQDLWRALDDLVLEHVNRWEWVAGHADHIAQNRCKAIVLAAAREQAAVAECDDQQQDEG